GTVEVAAVHASATEVASAGTGPGTAAATAASTAAKTAAATAAASTAAASAPPLAHEGQRRTCPLRRGGGDIATHAAAPGSRGGGCLGSHQPDQGDRRHVEQRLYHRRGLTRCIGSELLSSSRLLGAGVGLRRTLTGAIPAIFPADRNNGRLSSVTRLRIYVKTGPSYGISISERRNALRFAATTVMPAETD